MLEYFGVPASYVEVIHNGINRVAIRLESVDKVYYPSVVANPVVSERAERQDAQKSCRSRTSGRRDNHDSDSLTFLDPNPRAPNDTVTSEDSRHADHHGRSSRSKPSTVTTGAIRPHSKGRRHPGLIPLKPTNPSYQKFFLYQYCWLKDFSIRRTPCLTGKVKNCTK